MIKETSVRFSETLLKNSIIKDEDKEVYQFGMEMLIATAVNFLILLALGVLFNRFIQTIVFLLSYCTIRPLAGGFHAKNHFRCIILFFLSYLVLLLFITKYPVEGLNLFLILGWITSFLFLFFLAPVQDSNHPIDEEERKLYSKKSKIAAGMNTLLLAACFFLLPDYSNIFIFGTIGFIAIGFVVFIGFLKNRLQ